MERKGPRFFFSWLSWDEGDESEGSIDICMLDLSPRIPGASKGLAWDSLLFNNPGGDWNTGGVNPISVIYPEQDHVWYLFVTFNCYFFPGKTQDGYSHAQVVSCIGTSLPCEALGYIIDIYIYIDTIQHIVYYVVVSSVCFLPLPGELIHFD